MRTLTIGRAIPAVGASTLAASDVVNATLSSAAPSTFPWAAMGYNVPDEFAGAGRQLDFAQAAGSARRMVAGQHGLWLWHGRCRILLQRWSCITLPRTLVQDSTCGEALQRAKQLYVGGAPSGGFGTYDEKAMIEADPVLVYRVYQVMRPRLSTQDAGPAEVCHLSACPVQGAALVPVSVFITPSLQLVTATVGNTSSAITTR